MWLRRGSHSDSYFVASVASSICSEPPRHSVTSSPVSSMWMPPGYVPAARCASKKPAHLVDDVVEASRLVAGRRREPVAVHRIGDPERRRVEALDRLEQRRQRIADLARTHAGDEGQPARLAVGIELVDELLHRLRRRRRPELDPDGIADAGEVVDVGAVEVAGALPDPEEVRASVDRRAVAGVDAGHRPLVVHQQALVAV